MQSRSLEIGVGLFLLAGLLALLLLALRVSGLSAASSGGTYKLHVELRQYCRALPSGPR